MYSLKDDQTMQHLLHKLFRDIKDIPQDTTIINLSQNKSKEWLITMLSICDDKMLESIRKYEEVELEMSLRYEPDEESKNLNLIVRVDAFVPTDHLIFETVISYLQNSDQKLLAQQLIDKSKLTLFMVNQNKELEFALRVDYDIEPYKTMLETITEKKYYPTKCTRCGKMFNLETETENFMCGQCQVKNIYGDYEL